MNPKNELPPANYTPEEMAKFEMSRAESVVALGKGGAEYKFNEKGEKENLIISGDDIENLRKLELIEKLELKYNELIRLTLCNGQVIDTYFKFLDGYFLLVDQHSDQISWRHHKKYKFSLIDNVSRASEETKNFIEIGAAPVLE